MKKVHKKRLRQAISSILAATMSLPLFTAIPVSAEIGKKIYNYDGYSVDYNVTNEWDGAQTVELTVSNTGTDPILNLALKYDAQGEISNLWNADLYEQNGDLYIIKNLGWNFEIAPCQSITYGYTLSGNNLGLPDNFEICFKRVDKSEGYDVQYNITKSWDVGVEGNIVITNTSAAPIEAWTLSFDSNFTIDNLWNGRVLENNGTSYTVAAEMWTNPVQPNSSMTIGFVGSKAADVKALLSNFKLTEVVIGEGGIITPDPKLEITANAVYDKESGNITVSWLTTNENGSFEIFVSEDGENYTSAGVVENTTEFVYALEKGFETLYFKVVQTVGSKSVESNVVKVSGSETALAIIASAYYDEESSNIKVIWITNNESGTFEVFISEDDENFTSLGTVENVKEFTYTPDGEFEVLYFKVKQTVGEEIAESESAAAYYPIDWEDETDTDNDGLTDVYEKYYFETDPTNPDTDGDGLPDGYEVYYLGTDSKKADTDDNGISDGDEDFDKDGLSNLREYELGTDPSSIDSDSDGLADGDEVNKYNTDPLKYDTDSDGIFDGDEVALGLDPASAATDGIPDSEHTFVQHIGEDSDNFSAINTSDNQYKVSIDITAAGVAANNLYADESGYSAFVSNEAILGIIPEFFYNDMLKVEKITINFDIGNEYVANTKGRNVSVSNELVGIKRFNIFKYFDDINMLLPIETFHDVANNRVYANVDEMGTYCLIDMEIWFEKLGIEPKAAEPQTMALSYDETSELKVSNDDNLDVGFVLYSSSPYFEHMKSELITTAEEIFNEAEERNISARLHFLAWTGDVYLNTSTGEYYAENLEDATAMINRSVVINTSTLYPSDYVLTKAISGIKNTVCGNLQENSKKYSFIVDVGCNHTCSSIHYGIQALQEQGFDSSFIYAPGNHNIANYNALSSNNSCYQFKLMPGRMMFSDFVIEHIFAEEAIIIKSNDLERLPDDFGEISTTSTQDYDGDGVPDVEEINFELINRYAFTSSKSGEQLIIPTLKSLFSYFSNEKKEFNFNRFSEYLDSMDNIRVSFVTTYPTKQDSDLDGFDDAYEIAMSRTYGLRGLTLIPAKHDDTIIFDSTIDDTNIFSGEGLPYDTYYQDNKDIECVRTKIIDGKNSLYQKNQYQFTRNSNTTAVYTITPDESSDYIIKFSAHLQGNAHFSIKQQLSGRLYADISDELWSVVYDTYDGDYRQINIKATLKGGVTYRIEMLDLLHVIENGVSKLYTLTIEQDNWVYTPYGAEAHYGNFTVESLKGDMVNGIVTNYVMQNEGSTYTAANYKDITEEQFENACDTHAEWLLMCLSDSSEDFALLGDIATVTGLVFLDADTVELLTKIPAKVSGGIGMVATITGGFVLFDSKAKEFKKYELKRALIDGKYNIKMYVEDATYVDSVTHEEHIKYKIHWYPWFEGECRYSNKYFSKAL